MALLDGELPTLEARVIATHLDACAECARLAERLRSTSQQLSAWNVPNLPAKVEKSVAGLIDGTGSNLKTDGPALPMGLGRWTWGRRAILWGGTMLAVMVALILALPFRQRFKREPCLERKRMTVSFLNWLSRGHRAKPGVRLCH